MNFSFTKMNIQGLKVNIIGQGCVLNYGQSHLINRNAVTKKNQGFGEQNADEVFTFNPFFEVDDGDIEDNNSFKRSFPCR
ncbi:hypothetical protein [Falsibacillus pallidus]|uniref:Spore germination protein GerPA/GerPF n=1 Tax=Falsibacillus pallidus TaxID=493781 RepID=A0A370GHT7_9BACI|nr:hypothetical protein [Falsibacillus pallidus]RDI43217.1 hypothetical protein DFR59_104272 [Falsibacillus pallidus]